MNSFSYIRQTPKVPLAIMFTHLRCSISKSLKRPSSPTAIASERKESISLK